VTTARVSGHRLILGLTASRSPTKRSSSMKKKGKKDDKKKGK